MSSARLSCHSCGRDADFEGPIPRRATCSGCGNDLRCCLNCRHHQVSAYNECSESNAEAVLEKADANFCDWFQPGSVGGSRSHGGAADSPEGSSLNDLEELFKS